MKIKSDVLSSLEQLARRCVERECCGVLWYGPADCIGGYTQYPGPAGESAFEFSDDWWLEQLYQARGRGMRFAGLFHSHPPDRSTYPSLADRRGHSFCRTLILSGGEEPTRCFVLGSAESLPSEEPVQSIL